MLSVDVVRITGPVTPTACCRGIKEIAPEVESPVSIRNGHPGSSPAEIMIRDFVHMLRYCRPQWRLYAFGTLALLVVDVLDTFTPKLIQWAINHVTAVGNGETPTNAFLSLLPDGWFAEGAHVGGMWTYGVAYTLIIAATGFFRLWMSLSFARAGVRLIHHLRGGFFSHLLRLSAGYHDTTKIGDHMSLATNDTESVRMFFGIGLLILIDTLFYFILVPLYMTSISWKLTLACLIPLPLIPIIVAKLTHVVERRWDEVQAQFATVSERARESFAGVRVVKTFAREDFEVRSFAKQARKYYRRSMSFARVFTLEMPILVLMLGLADLIVVAYGGSLVLNGEIQVGDFVAFFQYLIRLSGPMIGLGWTIMLYQRGKVSMARIEKVTGISPGIQEPETPVDGEPIRGGIEIRGLTFSYGEDSQVVLRDIDVTIAPGQTLGVMGPVGSGKTTLLNLIPRLYDPPAGTVFVNGKDVRTLPLKRLRRAIGTVPQEAFLFSLTIRENVAGGVAVGRAREGLVEAKTRIAKVSGDIRDLRDGYDTLLGEKGVNLSGGQKQRIAIARALAREPAILIFDDCLSAVDTETETEILGGLREASRERTTVIASHRVSAVKEANEIIVLDEGRIVERGTHAELIRRGGYYAELDRKQSEDGE